MAFTDYYRKDNAFLWTALGLFIAFVCYRLAVAFLAMLFPIDDALVLVVPTWLYNLLSLVLVAVLWKAYHRWMANRAHRRELEFVIRGMGPDVLLVINREREITMCNEAVEGVFGYRPDEVIGWRTDRLYFDRRLTGERHEIYNRIRQVGFHTGFAKGRRRDGRVFPLEVVTGELPYGPGAVILIRDITERKQAEDELIRAKEAAEQAHAELADLEKARDDLTHMIVHDLKSPLTAIAGYLDLLMRSAESKFDERELRFLNDARGLTHKLSEMIHSLLDLRRLQTKDLPLDAHICDLAALAREALHTTAPDAESKNITVAVPALPTLAFCDAGVIRRVIVNLLNNAVKFTPEWGSIRVHAAADENTARLSVSDSGCGIPAEYQEKIFEQFAQLEIREFSTGLGLTFCKLAVEAHGGCIGLDSREGAGSTFWFELPASPDRVRFSDGTEA